MKIQNEQSIGASQDADRLSAGQQTRSVSAKSFQELTPGDRFKAAVIDIQQGQVTIRLDSGDVLTAKSMVLPEARIGEDSIFLVTENIKGQILLEMIKPDNQALQTNLIREALMGAGQPATKENIELVRALMERQLPIDGETIQKALFFQYALPDESEGAFQGLSMDKVLFLLEEDFPVNKLNIGLLNNLMNRHMGLKENMAVLLDELLETPDSPMQRQLIRQLLGGMSEEPVLDETLKDAFERSPEALLEKIWNPVFPMEERLAAEQELRKTIKRRLFFPLDEQKSVTDFQRYFKELHETIKNTKETLRDQLVSGSSENLPPARQETLLQLLTGMQDNLEFMNHIHRYKDYVQLPFIFQGQENEGELVIFKNPAKKTGGDEQSSVLIGLDYAFLGRVEILINKYRKNLTFQFRFSQDDPMKTINQNFHKLAGILNGKGYLITNVTFKKLTLPFRLTDSLEKPKKESGAARRYSFDMRV